MKYKAEVFGKGGIVARVVAHSKSAYSGQEIVTWEYDAPKCILAEINTHRLFSRNAQSSRAVPVSKVIEQIRNNPVTPIYWGSNQPGMVAGEEIDTPIKFWTTNDSGKTVEVKELSNEEAWKWTANYVAEAMQAWEDAGYHKQIVNRIGEAFTMIKGVITATESDNFFHLRVNPTADPFIQELARCMVKAYKQSEHEVLYEGEWHTPYVEHYRHPNIEKGKLQYLTPVGELNYSIEGLKTSFPDGTIYKHVDLERAKQISAAACAQVSFRKLDLSDKTVNRVYSRLVDDETPHASCVEHQATPMKVYQYPFGSGLNAIDCFKEGVSHMDREGNYWSGNFKGFVQNRKLLPKEACWNYEGKE